jgi:DnaJ like chaperone protein
MAFIKWIGGGIGWASGGFIGGIIGFAIGSLLDFAISPSKKKQTQTGDFRMSLLVLISCVLKADGVVKRSELDAVKNFLRSNFKEEETKEALAILKTLLEQDVDYKPVAMQIRQNMNYSARLELVHILYVIAMSDGEVVASEDGLIQDIALKLGLSQYDVQSVRATFFSQRGNYSNNRGYSNTARHDDTWAYQILEIDKSVSNDEVKKAYRRMAMKYHPDKLNTLGEEVKKAGAEKFKAVQEAYDFIKKQRGMA